MKYLLMMELEPPGLYDAEHEILGQITQAIINSRQERSERVQACLEAYAKADDITRQVAGICIEHYINNTGPERLLARESSFLRPRALYHAPGLYMASGALHTDIMRSGEFISAASLGNAAESLGFKSYNGMIAAEFMYQWIAAMHPDSKASKIVKDYVLRSGRMSHNVYGKGNFNTGAVLIHRAVASDYIETVDLGITSPHTVLDPVICLAVSDDRERAVSMMSHQRRRLIR